MLILSFNNVCLTLTQAIVQIKLLLNYAYTSTTFQNKFQITKGSFNVVNRYLKNKKKVRINLFCIK